VKHERTEQRDSREELTDMCLVEQYCAGSDVAFEMLIQRYQERLYAFIFSVLRNEEAHDVLQHVWIQALSHLQETKTKTQGDSLKNWLFQIARNRCIDLLRMHRALLFSEIETGQEEDSVLSFIPDPSQGPEELLLEQELRQQWMNAVEALPLCYREIIRMRLQGLKFEEIGHTLRMPESTAKTYCRRARLRLRKPLLEKGVLGEQPRSLAHKNTDTVPVGGPHVTSRR
jgi:RNA polymerase sigma factor (sigma-70 family)